jgi:hypothetical protein
MPGATPRIRVAERQLPRYADYLDAVGAGEGHRRHMSGRTCAVRAIGRWAVTRTSK